jgi:hypothetical protein
MIHGIVVLGSFVIFAILVGVNRRIRSSAIGSLIGFGLSFVLDVSDVTILVGMVGNFLLTTIREHDVIASRDSSFAVTSFLLAVVNAGMRIFYIEIVVVCSMFLVNVIR